MQIPAHADRFAAIAGMAYDLDVGGALQDHLESGAAAGLVIVAIAPNLVVVIIGGLVMGAGLSLLFPALALIVIHRSDQAQQGAALGAFTSFWDLGIAVGAPICGVIASLSSYTSIYYVMAGCAVASAALSLAKWVPGQAVRAAPDTVPSGADSPAG